MTLLLWHFEIFAAHFPKPKQSLAGRTCGHLESEIFSSLPTNALQMASFPLPKIHQPEDKVRSIWGWRRFGSLCAEQAFIPGKEDARARAAI